VDPRAGLDDVEKRKFFTIPGLNSYPSVVQPVASRYTDYANQVGSFPVLLKNKVHRYVLPTLRLLEDYHLVVEWRSCESQ
jgi:hypothetical protein